MKKLLVTFLGIVGVFSPLYVSAYSYVGDGMHRATEDFAIEVTPTDSVFCIDQSATFDRYQVTWMDVNEVTTVMDTVALPLGATTTIRFTIDGSLTDIVYAQAGCGDAEDPNNYYVQVEQHFFSNDGDNGMRFFDFDIPSGSSASSSDMATSSVDQTQQNFFFFFWTLLAVIWFTVWLLRGRN